MIDYEQTGNPETISQQFINYVTSHSNAPQSKAGYDIVREGYWNINVRLPLVADTIEKVYFGESIVEDGYDHTVIHRYDIALFMRSELIGYFVHRPADSETPFDFCWGEADFLYTIEEKDIARLLDELREYEASGQMTKAETPSRK